MKVLIMPEMTFCIEKVAHAETYRNKEFHQSSFKTPEMLKSDVCTVLFAVLGW